MNDNDNENMKLSEVSDYPQLVEFWCSIYKKMQHNFAKNSERRRFYFCNSYWDLQNFMQGMNVRMSPCVIMESNLEGEIEQFAYDKQSFTIHFCVRSTDAGDGHANRDAKKEAKEHMRNFLNWLNRLQHDKRRCPKFLRRMDFSDIEYKTQAPFYDGWVAVYLTIHLPEQYNICVVEDEYVDGMLFGEEDE